MDFYILVSPCCADSYSWQAFHSPGAEPCVNLSWRQWENSRFFTRASMVSASPPYLVYPLFSWNLSSILPSVCFPHSHPHFFSASFLFFTIAPSFLCSFPSYSAGLLLSPSSSFLSMFSKPTFQFYSFIQSITCFSRAAATQIFSR